VEKAIQLHRRLVSHFLSAPWLELSFFDIGQYYFDKKEFVAAVDTFRQLLRTYPENDIEEWVYFMLGESLFNQKDYVGAIGAYHQVSEERRRQGWSIRSSPGWVMLISTSKIMRALSNTGKGS